MMVGIRNTNVGFGEFSSLGLVPNGRRNVTRVPADLLALVPKPTDNQRIVKGTNPDPIRDTVPLIKKLVRRQLWQGKKLAERLKGNSVTDTARNYWNFIFNHIQYTGDGNDEVVRSLRRLIYDGQGDCDCFTTALSNLLLNASIPHFLRVAKYKNSSDWSHIYIVIPRDKSMSTDSNGNMKNSDYITLDCVPHQFNYEVPFTDHKDFAMKLISLDGLDCACGCETKGGGIIKRPTKRVFLSGKELQQMGLVSSELVLTKAGIQTSKDAEGIIAVTPSGGQVKIPDYISVSNQDKLVNDVRTFTPATTDTQAVTKKAPEKNLTPTKAAGGAILGLLAITIGVGAMRSNPTGLSGTPTRGKKRMAVLHM
jgi:hypothetical protein